MESVFGVSTVLLAQIIGVLSVISVVAILILGLTNRVMLRLGFRHIPRNPFQSILIVIGLMLSTTIIGASLGVGDTVNHSIKKVVFDSLAYVDIIIESQRDQPPIQFEDAEYIRSLAFENELVDGVIFSVETVAPVIDTRTNRTESRMTIRGYSHLDQPNFGDLKTIENISVQLSDLDEDEILINEVAYQKLDSKVGDVLQMVTPSGSKELKVYGILKNGGLASGGSTPVGLMKLVSLQNVLSRTGEIDQIAISNKGGIEDSIIYSDDVTKYFRLNLLDRSIAEKIFNILNTDEVSKVLKEKAAEPNINKDIKADLEIMIDLLDNSVMPDNFVDQIGDQEARGATLSALSSVDDGNVVSQVGYLSRSLGQYNVEDYKASAIRFAETIGSAITLFLSIFGSFSIVVGLLLIFLVMILLAAARKNEMGMSRAVGFKRSHLIRIFTLEGSIYAMLSSTVGVIFGIIVSIVLVELLKQAIPAEDDFQIYVKFTLNSVIITWGAGFLLTLITVIISSYRISRLNIIVAIRGLEEELAQDTVVSLRERTFNFFYALGGPITYLWRGLRKSSKTNVLKLILMALVRLIPFVWIFLIVYRIFLLVLPVFKQGWIFLIVGSGLVYLGIYITKSGTLFVLGVSIAIIGLGLVIRKVLSISKVSRQTINRIGATIEGGLLLVFWGLPFDFFEKFTGELESDPSSFILAGVFMVGASVWLVMNNTQILIFVLTNLFGNIPGLRAVLKTAIAYPVAATFRTGLTISMFALIIFTLMINAVLTNLNNVQNEEPDRVTGGFDIIGSIDSEYEIDDFTGEVDKSNILSADNFSAVARSTNFQSVGRQKDSDEKEFKSINISAVDKTYLDTAKFSFSHYDLNYGKTSSEIWMSLSKDPSLAVINNAGLGSSGDPFGPPQRGFSVEGFDRNNEPDSWESIFVQLRSLRGGDKIIERKIIAVIDPIADSLNEFEGSNTYMVTSGDIRKELTGKSLPYTKFSIQMSDNATFETKDVIPLLETIFLYNGLDAVSTQELIDNSQSQNNAFTQLFQGFMGLGLVVGVAAIGVLSIRAVVERRQSIGMLRAIGYRSGMIQIQFLAEALFITLLGVFIGLGLGTLISWNIFQSITEEVRGLEFTIPWVTVLMITGITSFFALLSAYIPARQASKIYPAETLRYE